MLVVVFGVGDQTKSLGISIIVINMTVKVDIMKWIVYKPRSSD